MNTLQRPASSCRLTAEFYRDLLWWDQFLDTFNGSRSFIEKKPIVDVYTDASLKAAGAFFRGDWLYTNFIVDTPHLMHMHINHKEVLAIVFAALRWCKSWQNQHVIIHTDNMAAKAIINKGTTNNSTIMAFLRLLFWLSAIYNFRITAVYIPGTENTIADNISRLHEPCHMLNFFWWLTGMLNPALVFCSSVAGHISLKSYLLLSCRRTA